MSREFPWCQRSYASSHKFGFRIVAASFKARFGLPSGESLVSFGQAENRFRFKMLMGTTGW